MNGVKCDEFLADSARFEAHAESCESCRKAMTALDRLDHKVALAAHVEPKSHPDASNLPLAPWEGARQRSWGPVIAAGVLVALLGAAAFFLIGISPIDGFIAAITGNLSVAGFSKIVRSAPNMLARAPLAVHIVIFTSFVIVNVIFVSLLRRRTKGYDVSAR